MTQKSPSRLIPTVITPTYDAAGRPVFIISSSNDADYDHVAVWREIIAKCAGKEAFPVVISTANTQLELNATPGTVRPLEEV